MTKFIFVYITNPSEKMAKKVAMHLLNKRLIACANIFPINSSYWWKEKIVNENEVVLLSKTLEKNFEDIKKEIKKIHLYSIPFVAKIDAEINQEYLDWMKDAIS